MLKSKKIPLIVGLASIAVYTWLIWPKSESAVNSNATTKDKVENEPIAQKPRLNQEEPFVPVAVKAPESKISKEKTFKITNPKAIAFNETQELANKGKEGSTPAISQKEITESSQLQAAIEATQNPEKLGNRLSPLKAPTVFDKDRFISDASYRQEYLNTAEPARAHKSDPNSKTKIERLSPYYLEVEQGSEVVISVKAAPSMPVSIMSADLGQFKESGLTYATVLADAGGVATFTFKGVEGTFSDSNILVASPAARGKLKFIVHTKIKTNKEN